MTCSVKFLSVCSSRTHIDQLFRPPYPDLSCQAAVVGDTVGDPLKDTSGPSLNILMKLMAIISLVFAEYFQAINNGQGVFNIST